jgi:hypothetical protein
MSGWGNYPLTTSRTNGDSATHTFLCRVLFQVRGLDGSQNGQTSRQSNQQLSKDRSKKDQEANKRNFGKMMRPQARIA